MVSISHTLQLNNLIKQLPHRQEYRKAKVIYTSAQVPVLMYAATASNTTVTT